jgi:zona occludens toxin (predicted ATPase)
LFIGVVVLMAVTVSGVIYAIVSGPSARTRRTGTSSPTKTVSASGAYVSPKAPYALAVTPNGDLLVVDSGRDQILRRLPSASSKY